MSSALHRLLALLCSLCVLLSGAGSRNLEQAWTALAGALFCACDLCEEILPTCCEESGDSADPARPGLGQASHRCLCNAVPSTPESDAPRSAPSSSRVEELAKERIESGAFLSARTPVHPAGPADALGSLSERGAPRAAAPAGTALTGAQRLQLAGAGRFVCVLCCLRT